MFLMTLALGVCSAQTYNATFSVDMQDYTGPAYTTMTVNGGFAGWCGDCYPMTNTTADIWETTIAMPAGVQEWKYAFDNWSGEENLLAAGACVNTDGVSYANRIMDFTADVVLPTVCWNSCADCGAVSASGCMDADAQNYDMAATVDDGSCAYLLTVTVDMSQVTDPFTTPAINGTYNGWCGACNPLTDNGDGTWTGTFTVPNGQVDYKFTADGWTIQESLTGLTGCVVDFGGNWNRVVDVTGDTVVGEVCWNSCSACTSDISGCMDLAASNYNAAATIDDGNCTYLLTLSVDLSQLGAIGPVNSVFGSFNGWTPGATVLTDMGGGVFSVALDLPNGDYEYKFHNDGAGAIGEEIFLGGEACTMTTGPYTNRLVTVSGDTTVDAVCWESCDACAAPAADVRITAIDNTTGDVTLTNLGSAAEDISAWRFCNWPAYSTISSLGASASLAAGASEVINWADVVDADGELGLYIDAAWTNSASIVDYVEWASTGHQRSSVAVGAGVWNVGDFVDGPAPYTFNGASGDYGSAFWDVNNPTYDVTLVLDLSNETPNALGVYIAGSFQGWNPGATLMTNNGDGTWSYTVNAEEGSEIAYIFLNGNDWLYQETVPAECGLDNGSGGFNRFHTIGAADETLDAVCFSSCVACVPLEECNDVNAVNYNAMAATDAACLYNTTFTIDMNDYVPAFTILNVSGEWNGFCGDCNVLSDDDMDGVWSGTFAIPDGAYTYKFQVDSWTDQEALVAGAGTPCFYMLGGFTNRILNVEAIASNDIPEHCWNSCYACPAGGVVGCTDAAANNYDALATEENGTCLYDVTFQLDMSQVADAFTIAEVNGSFNGWCGGCNPLTDNGDGTWAVTIELQAGSYEYKYAADAWNIQEDLSGNTPGLGSCVVENSGFFNRSLLVGGDVTEDLVCWNLCSVCPPAIPGCMDANAQNYNAAAQTDDGSCSYLLTVTVNMSQVTDGFTIPEINGTYNGWCGGCNQLSDNGDGTWTGTFTVPNGQVDYKFAADAWNIQEDLTGLTGCVVDFGGNWNRVVDVTGDTVVDVVCWNSCDDCVASGCTDPLFVEFDPYATVDDGSCSVLAVEGCAYTDADNYDVSANTDDGSCLFTLGSTCPGDFTGDGFVNVSDLGGFLGAFGTACD